MEHCLFCDIIEKHLGDTESIATACARCSAWWAFCQDHDIMKPGKQPLDDATSDFIETFTRRRALEEMADRAILAAYPPGKLAELVMQCSSR